jgi:ubiquinone/menaquinone biosynthesis C-methylase UbiE
MSIVFKFKAFLLTLLIKYVVAHPRVMASKVFVEAMRIFPERISKTYDADIAARWKYYYETIEAGLTGVTIRPEKVLDLCTGTGIAAFIAAKRFRSATIEAIDQSSGMIRIAQEKAMRNGIHTVRFKEGNAAALMYDNDQFDLIVTSNAPVYIPEASRVLTSGGQLLIVYSFGKDAFIKAKEGISRYIRSEGLKLIEIKDAGNGVYIRCEKE